MELKDVFTATALVLVGVFAVGAWINDLNSKYGTEAGSSFSSTFDTVESTLQTELGEVAVAAGNNTVAAPGAGGANQQDGIIARSLSSIQQVGQFFILIPNLLSEGAYVLGLPEPYAEIAGWVFAFALGITLALIFLQVVAGRVF